MNTVETTINSKAKCSGALPADRIVCVLKHTTQLCTLAAGALLLSAMPSPLHAAMDIATLRKLELEPAPAARVVPLSVTQLPEARPVPAAPASVATAQAAAATKMQEERIVAETIIRPGRQPLRIYIPNPKALENLPQSDIRSTLDTNDGMPGAEAQQGNADRGNGEKSALTLPTVTAEIPPKNTSAHGALYARLDGKANRIQQAISTVMSPFNASFAAVNSLYDNTRILVTDFAQQAEKETTQWAMQTATPAPNKKDRREFAAAEPVKRTQPKPSAPQLTAEKKAATAQPNETVHTASRRIPLRAPDKLPAPVPGTLAQTTPTQAVAAPVLAVESAPLTQTREESINASVPISFSDLADAMPAAPAQVLAEGPVSGGPIIYYRRASADLTALQDADSVQKLAEMTPSSDAAPETAAKAEEQQAPEMQASAETQQASQMSTLIPAAGAEDVGPQGPLDTSPALNSDPVMGAPEAPTPIIPPTATETVTAAGVASETPSPVAPPPSKSESAIAITDTKELPADVKKTLNKTPSGLSTKEKVARGKKPVDIERSKDGDGAEAFMHDSHASGKMSVGERLNVKIQQRAPSLDLNYELELAYNALMSGNTEAAVQRYNEVLANDKNNKNALFGLATVYHRLGQADKARALYARLLKLDPAHRDGLNNYLALAAETAPQEALNELESLESRNPDFGPIPAQMAIIYQRMGQTDQALEKMIRAVSLTPNNITYVYNLAVLFDKAGKYQDAAGLYKQIIDASYRGESPPADLSGIQQRLTFLSAKHP